MKKSARRIARQGSGKSTRRAARKAIAAAPFTREERVLARNESYRRYIAGKSTGMSEARSALQFVAQDHAGGVPEYGEAVEADLERIMRELRAATAVV